MRDAVKKKSETNSLRHFFETRFKPAKLANRNRQTVYQYELNMRRLEEFMGRTPLITDLTDETITTCMAWLKTRDGREGKKMSAASIGKFRDNFCYLWKYLNAIRIVDTLPTVDPVPEPKRIPRAWTKAELDQLWQALARLPGEICGIPTNLYMLNLHSVLWDTGGRISETLSARWSDVDLSAGFLLIKAEERKGQVADKLSKLHAETIALLRKILLPERQLIWPQPGRSWNIHTVEKQILKAAGLPYQGREFSFHTMRKAVASHVKALGGDPAEALGHWDASGRTCAIHYIDPRIAPRQFAADVLFRPGTFAPRIHREDEGKGERDEQKGKRDVG